MMFHIPIFIILPVVFVTGNLVKTGKPNKINNTYIVTYFNIPAVGESLRFLLSYGDLPWLDNRIEIKQWGAFKSSMPFGQMPTLEYDGKVAHQSIAISRYLAKKVNLTGNDDWEDLEIDATVDTISDLRLKLIEYHYEENPIIKENKKGLLFNNTLPFYLEKLEFQANKNKGYLAAKKLTWADLFFVSFLDYFNWIIKKDIVADSPTLKRLQQNIYQIPNIKAWIEKRPAVNFDSFMQSIRQ